MDRGPSINYVVWVSREREGFSPKDDLLHQLYLYLIEKRQQGEGPGGQKLPVLRRHSLWMALRWVTMS